MPPPTAYMDKPVKVAKTPFRSISLLAAPSLFQSTSLSVPRSLSVCLWSTGIATRPADSVGGHTGIVARRARDWQEAKEEVYGEERRREFFFLCKFHLASFMLAQLHKHMRWCGGIWACSRVQFLLKELNCHFFSWRIHVKIFSRLRTQMVIFSEDPSENPWKV